MTQEIKVAVISTVGVVLAALVGAGGTILAARSGKLPEAILPSPSASTVVVAGPTVTRTVTATRTVTENGPGGEGGAGSGGPKVGSQIFLTDLQAIAGSPGTMAANLSGRSYPNSVAKRVGGCQTKGAIKYDVSQLHGHFTTRVGLDSRSDSDAVVVFSFYIDGKPVTLGPNGASIRSTKLSSTPVAFAVTGVELEMRWNFVKGDMGLCSNAGSAVWGDPVIAASD